MCIVVELHSIIVIRVPGVSHHAITFVATLCWNSALTETVTQFPLRFRLACTVAYGCGLLVTPKRAWAGQEHESRNDLSINILLFPKGGMILYFPVNL